MHPWMVHESEVQYPVRVALFLSVQRHTSPWLVYADLTQPCTALSKSQSAKTIAGFLPPNSNESFFTLKCYNSNFTLEI